MTRGRYIVFEGVVGTGKTTQSKRLVEELRRRYPDREVVWTREPGGSEVAEAIRTLVQGTMFAETMDPVCEAYLYAAARAQSLRVVVQPVLERGGFVVADRCFASSVAFQGAGRGLGTELVLAINATAIEGLLPDVVIELDLDLAVGLQRSFDARGDKFEAMPREFFDACIVGYRALAAHDLLKGRWHGVDASGTSEEVWSRVLAAIEPVPVAA